MRGIGTREDDGAEASALAFSEVLVGTVSVPALDSNSRAERFARQREATK